MMRWIVGSSLRFRVLVVALAGGMMMLGVIQVQRMPVDVFPEFAPPRVEIQTPCLGLSASEVEALVTIPLEDALNGVAGLHTPRAEADAPVVSVQMRVKPATRLLPTPPHLPGPGAAGRPPVPPHW